MSRAKNLINMLEDNYDDVKVFDAIDADFQKSMSVEKTYKLYYDDDKMPYAVFLVPVIAVQDGKKTDQDGTTRARNNLKSFSEVYKKWMSNLRQKGWFFSNPAADDKLSKGDIEKTYLTVYKFIVASATPSIKR